MKKPKPVRVLVFGFINMNVIDGSAFFLASLASMLTVDPDIEVDLLLANPVKRTLVYQDLLAKDNVRIIDPFSSRHESLRRLTEDGPLTHTSAAHLISAACDLVDYDLVVVRSTEVATQVVSEHYSLAHKCMLYVTGVVSVKRGVPGNLVASLNQCAAGGMSFLCQTEEMMSEISSCLPVDAHLITLPPMIPDVDFDEASVRGSARRFIYTGKFVNGWNPLEIVSGFCEVHYDRPDIVLTVAGDQFKQDNNDELFVKKIKHLLKHSPGVEWVGGVERSRSRDLISESDIGISWRASDLDDSLELSTKLLEYGSLGRPCIMNRTPMHERIFGVDYPFYANTMREYVRCIELAVSDSNAYGIAARRALEVSKPYQYTESFTRFLPHIVKHVARVRSVAEKGISTKDLVLVSEGAGAVRSLNGVTYVDLRRAALRYLLDTDAGDLRVGRILTSIGPVVAFETAAESHESQLDEVVVARVTRMSAAGNLNADRSSDVTRTSSAQAQLDLVNRSLQRALSDLHKTQRKVVVDVGAAHREFRTVKTELAAQHNDELNDLRRLHEKALMEVRATHEKELASLNQEIQRLRKTTAFSLQRKYWRISTKLKKLMGHL